MNIAQPERDSNPPTATLQGEGCCHFSKLVHEMMMPMQGMSKGEKGVESPYVPPPFRTRDGK